MDDDAARRRILVALEPTVLEGAFAALLGDGVRAEVVQFHHATHDELSGPYDAAIVTIGLANDIHPDLLITLPDTSVGGHVAHVTVGGVSRPVSVATNTDVIDLLAEHFPREIPDIR